MDVFSHQDFDDHEQVVFAHDTAGGLRAIIAVHSTALGPALGGCRIWNYATEAEAVTDVLRLSKGMSYKAALAGLALGGGKSVIIADSSVDKTPGMMRAMGRAVDRMAGRYIVAEDVGATVADMDEIARETTHVSGVSTGSGDPSPWTAKGVFLSMVEAARQRWGTGLDGRRVSVTGLGNVGRRLCSLLQNAGARLVVSDIRADAVERVVRATAAERCAPEDAHRVTADLFAPCALGAGLNHQTIPEIQAEIVCGAANNQLATAEDGPRLASRGILYAPDYLVNAGGLISVARGAIRLDDQDASAKLKAIPATLRSVLEKARTDAVSTDVAADLLARAQLTRHAPDAEAPRMAG